MGATVAGSCHCGAVRFEVDALPATVTSCNCSICRRLGTLWAYYHPDQVRLDAGPDAMATYSWGDRMLAFHHCRSCGCIVQWRSLKPEYDHRMGINARLFDIDIATIPIRLNDGAAY